MNKTKGMIITIIMLLIYGLVMYFVLNNKSAQSTNTKSNDTSEKSKLTGTNYMVVGNNSIYKFENGKYKKANKSYIEALPNMKVYIDNKYFGSYKLNYVSTWNLLNDKSEFVSYKGSLLAISNEFDVNVRNYNVREINDDDKYLLLKDYGINSFKNLTVNKVVDIDLDNNDVMDEIICLSSMEISDNINSYYNLVLIKYNDKVITLIEERKDKALYVYDIVSIINTFNNSNDSIIFEKIDGYYADETSVTNFIAKFENDNYVID